MTVTQTPAPTEALPDLDELMARLLSDRPLLDDTPDHLLQVVMCLRVTGWFLMLTAKTGLWVRPSSEALPSDAFFP